MRLLAREDTQEFDIFKKYLLTNFNFQIIFLFVKEFEDKNETLSLRDFSVTLIFEFD